MRKLCLSLVVALLVPGALIAQQLTVTVGTEIEVYEAAAVDAMVANLQSQIDNISNAEAPFEISDINGLQAALDGKADIGHDHAIAEVTSLQAALDGKANASHGHAIADVSGLQSKLDSKADDAHSHAIAEVADLQAALDTMVADIANRVLSGSSSAETLWAGNRAAYDAISPKDPNTVYVVIP